MPPREPIVALSRTQGLAVGEHGAIVADDPKQKLDVQAIGIHLPRLPNLLRFLVLSFRFPSKVGKRGNAHCHPIAHWYHQQQGSGISEHRSYPGTRADGRHRHGAMIPQAPRLTFHLGCLTTGSTSV
jgi:hypothetical protein